MNTITLLAALSLTLGLEAPTLTPLVRVVDLDIGDQAEVTLTDGTVVEVQLLGVEEKRDSVRHALREARVTVRVDEHTVSLASSTYHLPITVGPVQIDCPITRGYVQPDANPWAIDAHARLRLWPAGSPWIRPNTFAYPTNQRWFAGNTLMANEIGDDERHDDTSIYYHWGLDLGGAEKMVDVLAATDGVVVSAGDERLDGQELPAIVSPRYDVVYLRDARGWYYRYSHLDSIDPSVTPGVGVKMGRKIGVLGKRGASGGWSHLHFDVATPQPSGRYGITDGYAFLWQAYRRQYDPKLVAVARPHQLVFTDEPVTLDASRSISSDGGGNLRYEWTLQGGATASGAKVEHRYARSGTYSEIVKVTDEQGRVDYDFAIVQVLDRRRPSQQSPTIHAAYWPTFGIKPRDQVTFKVRSFRVDADDGDEVWDFGDGTPPVTVHSDGGRPALAPDGYALTKHAFERPGHYLVSVSRVNHRGQSATARLQVRVEDE